MLKKPLSFLVVLALMIVALSSTVMAAPVQGKLQVQWYDFGLEGGDIRAKVEELRDAGKLDTILQAEFSKKGPKGELSQIGDTSGHGLLYLEGDNFKNLVKSVLTGKNDPDGFGMVITGYITPKESGKYKFRLWSDDNAGLKIDGKWVCNFWGQYYEANGEKKTWEKEVISDEITLEAGKAYPIEVYYWEGYGGQTLQITWGKDGAEFSIIPTDVFSYDPNDGQTQDPGSDKPSNTSDVSMIMPLLIAGVAAFGGLKLKKK